MTPIAGPLAIPVKGARLTMVSYFATWCGSSKRWVPHVEDFVKQSGGSFPIAADEDHRIVDALPPSGRGQAIIVVDAQGIVRLVHRGTYEGVFEEVDAEIGRLLAQ